MADKLILLFRYIRIGVEPAHQLVKCRLVHAPTVQARSGLDPLARWSLICAERSCTAQTACPKAIQDGSRSQHTLGVEGSSPLPVIDMNLTVIR